MQLTRKFALSVTLAIVVVLGANAAIGIQREIRLFEDAIRNDSLLIGRAVAGAAKRTWQLNGEAEAVDLVDDADSRDAQAHIRWVWFDAPPGDPHSPTIHTELPWTGVIVARGEDPAFGEEAIFTYVPIDGPRPAAIEVAKSLAEERQYLRRTIAQIIATTVLLIGACAALTLLVGIKFVGRPVRRLVEHARSIGGGNLGVQLDLAQRDEIGTLATEMNRMSERLAAARAALQVESSARIAAVDQLRHADRLATVGKLAAGIAHEIGTPLNVITGTAQLICADHPAGSTTHDQAVIVGDQARRVAAIVRQLLDFARPRAPSRSTHDLKLLAEDGAHMLEAFARKRGVALEVDAPAPVDVSVDAAQLHQVLTNLVANAIHASAPGATVTVRVSANADAACLAVEDRGTGISPESLERIFEPFFTTKDVGEGTGLGLSVAYGIVHEHGGRIDVRSEVGAGSTFTVYLPRQA